MEPPTVRGEIRTFLRTLLFTVFALFVVPLLLFGACEYDALRPRDDWKALDAELRADPRGTTVKRLLPVIFEPRPKPTHTYATTTFRSTKVVRSESRLTEEESAFLGWRHIMAFVEYDRTGAIVRVTWQDVVTQI